MNISSLLNCSLCATLPLSAPHYITARIRLTDVEQTKPRLIMAVHWRPKQTKKCQQTVASVIWVQKYHAAKSRRSGNFSTLTNKSESKVEMVEDKFSAVECIFVF